MAFEFNKVKYIIHCNISIYTAIVNNVMGFLYKSLLRSIYSVFDSKPFVIDLRVPKCYLINRTFYIIFISFFVIVCNCISITVKYSLV